MQELLKENENAIPETVLLDVENTGKEVICAELPTVEKYLLNAQTNLEKNGKHPIKLYVIKWLLKEIPKAQAALGCQVSNEANPVQA